MEFIGGGGVSSGGALVLLAWQPVHQTLLLSRVGTVQIETLTARWRQALDVGPQTYEEVEQAYSQALEPLSVGL